MNDERRDARLVDAIERSGEDAELEREARALREVLTHLAAQRDVWFATGEQLLDAWRGDAR